MIERFTFASPTCNPQPQIYGLQIIGVFPSRAAATVHSLEASAPGCPQAAPALARSEPAPIGATAALGHGSAPVAPMIRTYVVPLDNICPDQATET